MNDEEEVKGGTDGSISIGFDVVIRLNLHRTIIEIRIIKITTLKEII
jgi:hypothetical protein